jgi:hypothetical protein
MTEARAWHAEKQHARAHRRLAAKAGAAIRIARPDGTFRVPQCLARELLTREAIVGGLIYLIGLIVVIMFILSFLGLR